MHLFNHSTSHTDLAPTGPAPDPRWHKWDAGGVRMYGRPVVVCNRRVFLRCRTHLAAENPNIKKTATNLTPNRGVTFGSPLTIKYYKFIPGLNYSPQ